MLTGCASRVWVKFVVCRSYKTLGAKFCALLTVNMSRPILKSASCTSCSFINCSTDRIKVRVRVAVDFSVNM